MITTVDPSDGEDMYVDSTDVESPQGGKTPRKRIRKRTRIGKEEEHVEDSGAENEQDDPHPQNIIPRMKTTYPQPAEPNAVEQNWEEH
jgi:hypothetical protein